MDAVIAEPFAVVAGLVVSFTVFSLTAATLLTALGLPDDLLRNLAIAVVVVVGLGLLWPRLGDLLGRPFYALARRPPSDASDTNDTQATADRVTGLGD